MCTSALLTHSARLPITAAGEEYAKNRFIRTINASCQSVKGRLTANFCLRRRLCLADMSMYVFVLAAEIPIFLLQVNVFIAAIKLARQNGRYRGFFILYSLQNFVEIIAYVSVT